MADMPASIRNLVEAFGPASSDVAAVVQHADNVWAVTFLDNTQAVLKWCDAPDRLETSTQVARFEQPLSTEMLEVLLAFNLLSSETQGARMAWEPQDRTLHLIRDLPQAGCELEPLQNSLRSLVGTADYWREALTDPSLPTHITHPESAQ